MNKDISYCSPNNINNKITCFSKKSLITIAKEYNLTYPDDIIIIPKNINKKEFWEILIDKINKKTGCNNELCVLDLDFINSDSIIKDFRPLIPKLWDNNKNAWLSTTDINNVLQQYEDKHIDFKYIGAVPIDFNKEIIIGMCIVDELCKLNIQKLYLKGIRKISIVFNLDPHDKPGSHWVSLFVNLINGGIYYFDSYGIPPVKEISDLMERIRIQGNNLIEQNLLLLDNEHDEITSILDINNNIVSVINIKNFKLDTPIYLTKTKISITSNMYKIIDINIDENKLTLNKTINKKKKF